MKGSEVEILLKTVGKKIFVEYYDFFEKLKYDELETEDVVQTLPKDLSLKSRQTRTLKAKRIFKDNLENEAIDSIVLSNKVDKEIIEIAKNIQKHR